MLVKAVEWRADKGNKDLNYERLLVPDIGEQEINVSSNSYEFCS
jgi:hypothetical protein